VPAPVSTTVLPRAAASFVGLMIPPTSASIPKALVSLNWTPLPRILLVVSLYYIICVPLQPPPSDLVDTQEFSLNVGDKVHFETEPIVVQVTLPPVGKSLGITLAFDDDYCLCYLASCDAVSLFLQALPPYYRRNIYILTVNDSDPVTVDDTLAALKSCQVLHAMSRIEHC
jgi:hypothetical protein